MLKGKIGLRLHGLLIILCFDHELKVSKLLKSPAKSIKCPLFAPTCVLGRGLLST